MIKREKSVKKKAAKRPNGRPPYKVTDKLRDKVGRLAAAGMSQAEIGRVIKCDIVTLVKYFRDELEGGKAIIEKPVKLGKKDRLQWEAEHMDFGIYAPGPAPKFYKPDADDE